MIVVANVSVNSTLTKGKDYPILCESEYSYKVVNDRGDEDYFQKSRFDIAPETIQTNQKLVHTNGKTYEVKEVAGVVSLVEFVEPPIVGEVCLFNTDKVNINQNYGQVGFLTRIEEGLFYTGPASYTYCKTIKCIS